MSVKASIKRLKDTAVLGRRSLSAARNIETRWPSVTTFTESTIYVFVQPLGQAESVLPGGKVTESRARFFVGADVSISPGDRITYKGTTYEIVLPTKSFYRRSNELYRVLEGVEME